MRLEVRSTWVGGWIVALINGFFFSSVDSDQEGPRAVLINRFSRKKLLEQATAVPGRKGQDSKTQVENVHPAGPLKAPSPPNCSRKTHLPDDETLNFSAVAIVRPPTWYLYPFTEYRPRLCSLRHPAKDD
jgi:hypothetical protein